MRDEEFAALKAAKKAAKLAKAAAKEKSPSHLKKREQEDEGDDKKRQKTEEASVASVAVEAAAKELPSSEPSTKSAAPSEEWWTETWSEPSTSFSDYWLACGECGSDFKFSASEQKFFHEKGFSPKTRCADCTAAKKARFGEVSGQGTAAKERLARTTCYICGTLGHSAKECRQAPCYNCGNKGHKSKDCKEPRLNQAGGGVCHKFQTGQCTRGDTCRFAHVKE